MNDQALFEYELHLFQGCFPTSNFEWFFSCILEATAEEIDEVEKKRKDEMEKLESDGEMISFE